VKEFDATIAEKASEAKAEKLNGAEIVSVDAAGKKFKVKHKKKELEVSTNADTAIKKGKEPAAFEVVVTPGAKARPRSAEQRGNHHHAKK